MRNMVNVEEVIRKEDFGAWCIMNCFPEGLDGFSVFLSWQNYKS